LAGLHRRFKWALEQHYEYVFELDGDFSHNPDDIPAFLTAAKESELVLGSRYLNGIRIINWPLSRLLLSSCAAKYVQIVTGMPFTDPTGATSASAAARWKPSIWTASNRTGTAFRWR